MNINLGNFERLLLKGFLDRAEIFVFEKDFDERKYQEVRNFLKKITGIDIEEKAYSIPEPDAFPEDKRYLKEYSLLFYHPKNKYPKAFKKHIKKLEEKNPEYLEKNVGNLVLEWLPILLTNSYELKNDVYLIILFNKKPFSIDDDLPERVLERGHNWGASTEYKGRHFIIVYYRDPRQFLRILLHEIGHYLGLDDHNDNSKCVMTPGVEVNNYFIFCKECSRKLEKTLLDPINQ